MPNPDNKPDAREGTGIPKICGPAETDGLPDKLTRAFPLQLKSFKTLYTDVKKTNEE